MVNEPPAKIMMPQVGFKTFVIVFIQGSFRQGRADAWKKKNEVNFC